MTAWRIVLTIAAAAIPAAALPYMVRLGYPNCLSCHVSPQGGGLLNAYGKGIDEAQSLRGNDYEPGQGLFAPLAFGGRIDQDLRSVFSAALSQTPGGPLVGVNRSRMFYRNLTTLGKGFRLSFVADGEIDPALRKNKPYDPPVNIGGFSVATALLQYRPRDGFEIGAGLDALPTGLNIPDQTTYIKSRNRLGYYDAPAQVKAFFWGKRWLAAPFVFAPSGREPLLARESGAGMMAEFDLLGKGKTVIGFNGLRGSDRIGNRTMAGVYTRLGFGKWGVLAEHDFTARQLRASFKGVHFTQAASYGQAFFNPREWLTLSAIVERLTVEQPYSERLWAYKGEVATRLSANFTVALKAGTQRDVRTGSLVPIASIQLAMKTVN